MDRDFKITVGIIVMFLFGCMVGYEIASQENYDSHERRFDLGHGIGYQDGIPYQSRVDFSTIVLGLINIPNSGYYIVNQNYGNYKINATNQTEAIKELQKEISPCL